MFSFRILYLLCADAELANKHIRGLAGLLLSAWLCCQVNSVTGQTARQMAVTSSRDSTLLPRESASFEIVLGRLQLDPRHFRIHRRHELPDSKNGVERSICVSAETGRPELRYSQLDGEESWLIDVQPTGQVMWTRTYIASMGKTTVSYSQPATGPISIVIRSGNRGAGCKLAARSLWHLAASGAEEFDIFILPCLQRLDPSWDFKATLIEVDQTLQGLRFDDATVNREGIRSLVDQLGSSKRAIRQAARAKIENFGLAAWIPLENCRQRQLSPQQRQSVSDLLEAMRPEGHDAPFRIALWLSGDADY